MAEFLEENEIEKLNKEASFLEERAGVPANYVKIVLSTEGKLNAPPFVFVKNFTVEDLSNLSLCLRKDIPEVLSSILNTSILWNPDNKISVLDWAEEEVIELLIKIYLTFYSPFLYNMNYKVTKEDLDSLDPAKADSIIKGLWRPKFDIDLRTLQTYDLKDKKIKPIITFEDKESGTKIRYSIPTMKTFILLEKELYKKYNKIETSFKDVISHINNDTIQEIDDERMDAYVKYYNEKISYSIKVSQLLRLVSINDENVYDSSLDSKNDLLKKYNVSALSFESVEDFINNMEYGLKKEVSIINPITEKPEIRRWNFRLLDVLSTILVSRPTGYDIYFE